MSSTPNRGLSDFLRSKDSDKKEDRYDENVNALFEENGLYRKKLPKEAASLMKAVSDALYFTSNHHAYIQEILTKHLTQLIASDKLTPRLSSFQGNSMMLKDFCNSPQLPGFEKTNLELVSLLYKVRVVLYTMNEDHILMATIFNHNYLNTIELFRTKSNHYNAVFAKNFIEKAGVCQNIILNLIDQAVNGKTGNWKDLNKDDYVNITYESSVANAAAEAAKEKDSNNLDQFRITRGVHKKSLSDNFNTNFELMEEQQMKFYDAFMSAAPPDDFLRNIEKMRKDTAESNFSINANFDFIDEQALDSPFDGKEFAIKNYPISSNGLSPRASTGLELDSPMPAFTKAKFSNQSNILFNENLTLAEIERLEKTINTATTQESKQLGASPFYRPSSPPGLSPTKFSQRSFTDTIQTPKSELFSPSPTMQRDMQGMSPSYPYGGNSATKRGIQPFAQSFQPQRQYSDPQMQQFAPQAQQQQSFTLQSQQFNSMYMKRTGGIGTSMTMQNMQSQSDAYGMRQQPNGYDQGYEFDQNMDYGQDYDGMGYGGEYNGMVREKKKPIILDESNERYYGRLKFFDENKKYGFIVMEDDGSDIFVHYDDLCKAGITKELLRTARMGNMIRVNFGCMAYIGKYNKSRKAIDIQLA